MIMKAIVVNGPGDMQLVERPMPEIKEPNQVLVKVHAAGICGSDVHVYHGSNRMQSILWCLATRVPVR